MKINNTQYCKIIFNYKVVNYGLKWLCVMIADLDSLSIQLI